MNPNTGSFGSAIGGMSPELQAAVSRRQGNPQAGVTAQTSNAAPTSDPQIQAAQPPTGGTNSMAPSMPSPANSSGLPFDSTEAKFIVQTLGNRLKSISKMSGA